MKADRGPVRVGWRFEDSVFINCPFDAQYAPLFDALVFAIHDSGFVARCSLEVANSAQNRLEKIMKIISECRFSIHDLSRTDLDPAHNLPRFNMPLELGIDLGCRRFGHGRLRQKTSLVLDSEPYRYQKFISDIAGQDICGHSNQVNETIRVVRDFLVTESERKGIPGGSMIAARYARCFERLPVLCLAASIQPSELTFLDRVNFVTAWLAEYPLSSPYW